MSTRRKRTYRLDPRDSFTMIDELMASPTEPMPAAMAADRVATAMRHFQQITTALAPTSLDWRCCAMIGNIMEVLLELEIVQDPDKLLQDAFQALRAAAGRNIAKGLAIRLDGPGMASVRTLIEQYGEILAAAPHRTIINAYRQTERRMVAMDAGKLRAGDYMAQIDGRAA